MRFKVERTSCMFDLDKKPCEGVELNDVIRIDTRNVSDPKDLRYRDAETEWYSHGMNHRIENGYIKRDFVDQTWTRDFETLDEIVLFMKSIGGEFVIRCDNSIPEIEIYDTYRE